MVYEWFALCLLVVIEVQYCQSSGSCLEAQMCCQGRDPSCVVYSDLNNVQGSGSCYCDHACLKVGDCCDDFQYACGVINCEVSEWGPWTDCNAACGTGAMTRERSIIRPAANGGVPCPELLQKRSCYGTRCDGNASHGKANRETALILPATYSNIRYANASNDIRKNLRIRYKNDPPEDSAKQYCVEFEITKVTRACKNFGDEYNLAKAAKVCVRCESAAMRKSLSYRCQGHGVEHKTTRFTFLSAQQCHGRWQRKHIDDKCSCHQDGQADFIFV